MQSDLDNLKETLSKLIQHDQNYSIRFTLVMQAMFYASVLGYECGWRIDPSEPDWPVATIVLPEQGQISWHCPSIKVSYDGHTTETKFQRINNFCNKMQ